MSGHFVQELFQSLAPILNENLLENTIIISEWQLSFERFARKWWYNDLKNGD
jgi:hypothetical protein